MKRKSSMVISMRLPAKSGRRLKRLAARHGWTSSDASARLVEEGLRRADFALIDFRDSAVGRQAYLQGSSLAVWEVMLVAVDYQNDARKTARHLRWPENKVRAAFHYAAAFPDEMRQARADHDEMDFASLSQLLPQAREFIVKARSSSK